MLELGDLILVTSSCISGDMHAVPGFEQYRTAREGTSQVNLGIAAGERSYFFREGGTCPLITR